MFRIPNKFTGTDTDPSSFGEFQKLCYSLQGLGLGLVHELSGYEYPNNYYSAKLIDSEGDFTIFYNCFSPIIGFKSVIEDGQFLDKSAITIALGELNSSIAIPGSQILNEKVSMEHQLALSKNEVKELKYWLPASVGEVLFCSYFD